MLKFVLFIFPSLLGIDVYKRISKNKKSGWEYIFTLGTFVVVNNMLTMLFVGIININRNLSVSSHLDSVNFIWKYLFFSFIIALIIAFAYDYLEKNLKVELVGKKNETKKKK